MSSMHVAIYETALTVEVLVIIDIFISISLVKMVRF